MNDKAKFAVKTLKRYSEENGVPNRSTRDLSPLEQWLILQLKLVKESDSLPCVSDRFDDPKFIQNCCISYRHDYGLLNEGTRGLIEAEVKEVMRAIKNNAPYGR